eukprot:scaffold317082_cov18-Prasinocladus_malaysianus.AAC.1
MTAGGRAVWVTQCLLKTVSRFRTGSPATSNWDNLSSCLPVSTRSDCTASSLEFFLKMNIWLAYILIQLSMNEFIAFRSFRFVSGLDLRRSAYTI